MKSLLRILIPLLLATLACSMAVVGGQTDNNRPLLEKSRPSVIFLAPNVGERYAFGATILLHAQARDLGTGVARIEFYDNFDALIGTVTATNPQGEPLLNAVVSWIPPLAQTHFVRVKALRADGTASQVQEISVEVVPAPPGVVFPSTSGTPQAVPTTSTGASAPSAPIVQAAPPVVEAAPPAQAAATNAPADQAAITGQGGGEANPANPNAPVTLQAIVGVEAANVRVSPSTDAGIAMSAVTAGTALELVWRTADSQWAAIALPNGGFGWIFVNNVLSIAGDITTLPVATTE